jgi:hypothetical protein
MGENGDKEVVSELLLNSQQLDREIQEAIMCLPEDWW